MSLVNHGRCAARCTVVATAALALSAITNVTSQAAILPRPAIQASPVLLYRAAPNPAHNQQGVSMWVFSDGLGGSFQVRAMASGGQSAGSPVVPGVAVDPEPTWPAWISASIPLTWKGWKRIDVASDQFTYRRPTGAATDALAANFSDADTVGIDATRHTGTFYVSTLEWDGPDKTEATAAQIDQFTYDSAASWRLHGTPEALSAVVMKTGINPPVYRLGHQVMKVSFSAAGTADTASMAYLGQLATLATRPCIVLVAKSPFNRQLPDATPAVGDASLRVETFACPAQKQAAAFTIYATKPLTTVTVHAVGSLAIPGHNLPQGSVNIDVVKVAKEHGDATYADLDETAGNPGMLLKDDRTPIESVAGQLPSVRLSGDPVTNIAAHTQKQFWITINVPPYTPAGNYTQQLQISANQFQPFTITLAVNVLNLRLMSPSKQYAIAFAGKLEPAPAAQLSQGAGPARPTSQIAVSPSPISSAAAVVQTVSATTQAAPASQTASAAVSDRSAGMVASSDPDTLASETQYLSPNQFQVELSDIADHGFRYATLTDQGPALWDAAAAYMAVPGLGYPFLYSGFTSVRDAEQVDKERSNRKLDPFYYLDDNAADMAKDAPAFKAAGMESAVIAPDDNTAADGVGDADLAIHQPDDPYVQRLVAGGDRESNQRDWLGWNSASADPRVNRLYTGFVLFRANMYGAYAMEYENANGGDPFDDTAPRDSSHAGDRPLMATYPVQGGVIDTVQWEAAREGVTDVRYLTTFYAALRECKDNHVDRALVPVYEGRVKSLLTQPFWSESDATLQATRYKIAMYALRLRTDVDQYYAKSGKS